MKFCWSTLTVNNMEESIKFYQDIVGLPVDRRFQAGPGVEIAFLGGGETKVELISNGSGKSANVGPDISWGFEVADLDEKMEEAKTKGVVIQGGPFQPNPHTRFFYVSDPNGLKIQFVETK